MCGVSYGKNARASCKKLFEKIKANSSVAEGAVAVGDGETKSPTKRKPAAKETGVGARASPRKGKFDLSINLACP